MERKLAAVTNANEAMKYFESGNDIVLFDVMGPPREFVSRKAIHDHLMGFNGNFHFESLREGSHQRQRFAKAQRKPALSPRGLCTGPFTFALTPKHRNWPFFHGVLGHLSLSLLSSPKSAALCVGTYPAGNGSAVIFRSMLVNNRRVRWLSAKSSQ